VAASSLSILLCFDMVAERELVERVDGRMQMTLGQVQIERGGFQPLVSHQQLDGAQIGSLPPVSGWQRNSGEYGGRVSSLCRPE